MKYFKRYSVFLILFILPLLSDGQAIRVNYIGFSGYQKAVVPANYYYGFGYEQNIGKRIAILFEYNKGYELDENSGHYFFDDINSPVSFNYGLEIPWYEFAYQSKYFFTGNDDGSWYVSSGIALRKATYTMDIYSANYNQSGLPATSIPLGVTQKSYSLIPLSFKVGWRNSIDGWFGDYNIGISYIPGGNYRNTGNPNIDQYLTKQGIRSFCINVGFSFGVGWAD